MLMNIIKESAIANGLKVLENNSVLWIIIDSRKSIKVDFASRSLTIYGYFTQEVPELPSTGNMWNQPIWFDSQSNLNGISTRYLNDEYLIEVISELLA